MSGQKRQKREVASIPVIGSIYRCYRENIGITVGCLLPGILLTFTSEDFMKVSSWTNVLHQISINFYLSVGIMLAIVLGGIDLSMDSVLAVSGVIPASLTTNNGVPVGVTILLDCLTGTAIGLLNGLIIAFTDMPPLMVTIATMDIGRGVAYLYADGNSIRVSNDTFEAIGLGYLGPISLPVIYMAVILIFTYFLMSKSRMGGHIYTVGNNRQAAVYSETSVRRAIIFVYTLSGLAAFWTGIVLASRMASDQLATDVGHEADAITAAVLGETNMTEDAGKVGGVVLSALLIGMLNNGLNLLGANSSWQYVVRGTVILVTVCIDIFRKKKGRF